MKWDDLDFPPKPITAALLLVTLIALFNIDQMPQPYGKYFALSGIGLWFLWVIVWNFIIKPRL